MVAPFDSAVEPESNNSRAVVTVSLSSKECPPPMEIRKTLNSSASKANISSTVEAVVVSSPDHAIMYVVEGSPLKEKNQSVSLLQYLLFSNKLTKLMAYWKLRWRGW